MANAKRPTVTDVVVTNTPPVERSGWKSTKMHLSILFVGIMTAGWASLSEESRAATFIEWTVGVCVIGGFYQGFRTIESVGAKRREVSTESEGE